MKNKIVTCRMTEGERRAAELLAQADSSNFSELIRRLIRDEAARRGWHYLGLLASEEGNNEQAAKQ